MASWKLSFCAQMFKSTEISRAFKFITGTPVEKAHRILKVLREIGPNLIWLIFCGCEVRFLEFSNDFSRLWEKFAVVGGAVRDDRRKYVALFTDCKDRVMMWVWNWNFRNFIEFVAVFNFKFKSLLKVLFLFSWQNALGPCARKTFSAM